MQTATRFSRLLPILLAGIFLFTLLTPAAASETEDGTPPPETAATEPSVPETTSPTEESDPTEVTEPDYVFSSPYNLYFGLLHAHTNISDGRGTVEEAFTHAANVEGLDFFAVTDHSNSFDHADSGAIGQDGSSLSAEWAAGKAAAAAVTNESFLGIFGYEMTWPEIRQLGHITTYNTPGWLSRDQEGFSDDRDALAHYFEALATADKSISQFCHPGSFYGDFDRFRHYRAEYDDSLQLLETLGEGSIVSYIQALDQFWHVAPTASQNNHNGNWGSENDLRTVVLAESLTEDSLFEAIRARRVYATEDKDLHLSYELDGQIMGSSLSSAPAPEIALSVYDPTDADGCQVEVIAEGGITLATLEAEGNEDLVISVPGGFRWYFLKLTQADGDIAVTAPVWVEGFENMGISTFTSDAGIPIQGQALTLTLELFNDETVDFSLTSLEIYVEDVLIHSEDTPGTVPAGEMLSHSIPYTHPDSGMTELRAVIRGTVLGRERSYEASLPLRFRPGETVTGLLIDGSHGNSGLEDLTHLKDLAREAGMNTTIFTGDMPMGGNLLLIPPLQETPEDSFYEDVRCFLEAGGSLILLGCPESNGPGNALLEALGATMRFGSNPVAEGTSTVFNSASPWCGSLSENQFFSHPEGCDLDPGSGTWLAKDSSGSHTLLACEQTPWGGSVFAAGSPFLLDTSMPTSPSIWILPRANQTLFQAILGTAQPAMEQLCIGEVRRGTVGTVYRIKGYVTSGTSDPNTTFPNTIYLQDDTGGIAVTGFPDPGIQIGTPMELIGVLRTENGVSVLEYTDHQLPEESYYYLPPRALTCETAAEYDFHGGELVQVEGTVTAVTLTDDRKGICRLTVKDILGDTAVIEIEDAIRSGSTGENTLAKTVKKGRTVRVIGLLHINEAGETVIRVRDCDEVVYVPPKPDPTNPKTGDRRWWWFW